MITPLQAYLRRHRRAALLFSGGLDSSLLLAAAAQALGPGLTAITFTGPHTVPGELAAAWALARRCGVDHVVREFDPLSLPEFRHNRRERCYACKRAIITRAWEIAAARGHTVLVGRHQRGRPGRFPSGDCQALRELGVESPLLAAGLGKTAIRSLSRVLGLDDARPSQSCLATRFPYDTELTRDDLARVGRGEAWLRRRGFSRVRLRAAGGPGPPGTGPDEWPAFLAPAVRRPFTAFAPGSGLYGPHPGGDRLKGIHKRLQSKGGTGFPACADAG